MKKALLIALMVAALAFLAIGCTKKEEIEETPPAEEALPVAPAPAPAPAAEEKHAPSMDDVEGMATPPEGTQPSVEKVQGVDMNTKTGAVTPTKKAPVKPAAAPVQAQPEKKGE